MHARTCFRLGAVSSIRSKSAQLILLSPTHSHTYTRRLSDIDCQIGLGLAHVHVPRAAPIAPSVRHLVGRVVVFLVINGPAKPVKDTSTASGRQFVQRE